ncbi:MAG: hypothetical protein CMH26_09490 [Micavibrio sp.]|nr:hypothetical protein [Micavibrio sp.]
MVYRSVDTINNFEIRDDDRDISLKRVRGVGRGVDVFELSINGKIVEVEAFGKTSEIQNHIPMRIDWLIHCFRMPDSLKPQRQEVMQLMKEALIEYRYDAKLDWDGISTVTFGPDIKR